MSTRVFIAPKMLQYIERDNEGEPHLTTDVLFIEEENIKFVARNIHNLKRRHGTTQSAEETLSEVTSRMKQFIEDHDMSRDSSIIGNQLESLDYFNKYFTRTMDPGRGPYLHRVGDMQPDDNPFRAKPFGKKIEHFQVEDYRNADVWEPNHVFQDSYATRQHSGMSGMNNPHIIGAHRRHYDRNNSEGLSIHEKGSDRTWGYDMVDLYDATGNW